MKLSVLPTLNQLVLALDRYDQALADIAADKVEVTVGTQLLTGPTAEACKAAMRADLQEARARARREIEACGVELD